MRKWWRSGDKELIKRGDRDWGETCKMMRRYKSSSKNLTHLVSDCKVKVTSREAIASKNRTFVTRKNVAWTNVTVTIVPCLRWSQKSLKFGQNQVSDSWLWVCLACVGWVVVVCKIIFMSNSTYVRLGWVELGFWGLKSPLYGSNGI